MGAAPLACCMLGTAAGTGGFFHGLSGVEDGLAAGIRPDAGMLPPEKARNLSAAHSHHGGPHRPSATTPVATICTAVTRTASSCAATYLSSGCSSGQQGQAMLWIS